LFLNFTIEIFCCMIHCLPKRFPGRGLIFALLMLTCSCLLSLGQRNNQTKESRVKNLLFVYDFTLEKKPVRERVKFLDSIGFQGVTFAVNTTKDIDRLTDYQKYVKSETAGRLKIPAVFYHHDPENKNAGAVWKQLANQLSGTTTDIWVIVGKGKAEIQKESIVEFFRQISDYADSLRLDVVIYPHDKTYIESASASLWYIRQASRKNLSTSFHLCHELRAGNGARMNEAIAEVAPYIKLASISGSNSKMDVNDTPGYWDDAIKPLYKGDYDTTGFLEQLLKNGYMGPIALHTFGLKEPVDEHFSKSLETWKRMVAEVSARIKSSEKVESDAK
jgi:sugar phosphate isomerase/epimerase